MHKLKDITELVSTGNNDEEFLPMYKCVCGQRFYPWDFQLSIYEDHPSTCHSCGRKMFFRNYIKVYEVLENE